MTALPIHVDIWGGERGLFKATLRRAPEFGWTEHGKIFPETALWLHAYRERKKGVLPPLDYADLSPFTTEVLEALKLIQTGKTLPYAEIARRLGRPHAARAVGRACGANPFPLFIPCHRVISSDGLLGGYAFGLEIKELLLAYEQKI